MSYFYTYLGRTPQSFNVVNALRVLGRWMRMVTIPNQSSVAKAWQEFDEHGRMKPSAFYDRVVDVMEELFKFTLLVRDRSDYLVDRYSERKGAAQARAVSAAAAVTEPAAIPATLPPTQPANEAVRPRSACCASGSC